MLVEFKTKEEFKELKAKYESTSSACWKMYMYKFFKNETWCFCPEQDIFISLSRAKEIGIDKFN